MFSRRKIYTTGKYTLAVNIPKEIAEKAKLKKGDFVTFFLTVRKHIILRKVR
jgi:AbrB family looped-hinge helix DNA binding protein